jgi:hypothetical protein
MENHGKFQQTIEAMYVHSSDFRIRVHQLEIKWQHVKVRFF